MVMIILRSHQQVLHNLGVSKVSVPQHKDLTMRTSHSVLKVWLRIMNFVTGLLYLLAVNRLFYAHGRQKQGWGLPLDYKPKRI
jgi:hypothetical protein